MLSLTIQTQESGVRGGGEESNAIKMGQERVLDSAYVYVRFGKQNTAVAFQQDLVSRRCSWLEIIHSEHGNKEAAPFG